MFGEHRAQVVTNLITGGVLLLKTSKSRTCEMIERVGGRYAHTNIESCF